MVIIFDVHTGIANYFLNVRKIFQNSEIGQVRSGRATCPFRVTLKHCYRALRELLNYLGACIIVWCSAYCWWFKAPCYFVSYVFFCSGRHEAMFYSNLPFQMPITTSSSECSVNQLYHLSSSSLRSHQVIGIPSLFICVSHVFNYLKVMIALWGLLNCPQANRAPPDKWPPVRFSRWQRDQGSSRSNFIDGHSLHPNISFFPFQLALLHVWKAGLVFRFLTCRNNSKGTLHSPPMVLAVTDQNSAWRATRGECPCSRQCSAYATENTYCFSPFCTWGDQQMSTFRVFRSVWLRWFVSDFVFS